MTGLVGGIIRNVRFARFARANGLVHFGAVGQDDDIAPVRGFTAQAGQRDRSMIHGTIDGHDITLLNRAITHKPALRQSAHGHEWVVAVVRHHAQDAKHVLMLSHEHGRLVEEASAIRTDRSEHVALESGLDAHFLIYAHRSDVDDIRALMTPELVELLTRHPAYDYEFDHEYAYAYCSLTNPKPDDLNALLSMALAVTAEYEKSPA